MADAGLLDALVVVVQAELRDLGTELDFVAEVAIREGLRRELDEHARRRNAGEKAAALKAAEEDA